MPAPRWSLYGKKGHVFTVTDTGMDEEDFGIAMTQFGQVDRVLLPPEQVTPW